MAYAKAIGTVLKAAAKTIPWKQILVWVGTEVGTEIWPDIKKRIKKWIDEVGHKERTAKTKTIDELDRRVVNLEGISVSNSEVILELENQLKILAEAVQTLSARIILLAITSGISILIALGAIILVLVR